MKITRSMTNLTEGTTIQNIKNEGYYILTSDYDDFHGCYNAKWINYDEDGEEIIIEEDVTLTPSDLIGNEIV